MSLSKKIFIASSAVFVGALLFWGVYTLSFKKKAPADATKAEETKKSFSPLDILRINNKEKIRAISEESAVSPVISNDGNAISYYEAGTGKVFQVDLDGNNKKALSDKKLFAVENAFWSPDKNKALVKIKSSGEKNLFSYYDFIANTGGTLSENIVSATWQNSSKIVYTYNDPSKKTGNLSFSNPDGSEWKKLADLSYPKQKIALVPNSGLISFWNNPDANYETNLFTISPIQGDKKLIFKGKFGGDFLWNQQGIKILVSHSDVKNGHQTELAVINIQGQYKSLDLPTFASKCVWGKDGQTIFCALPGSIPDNSVLPNDYNNRKFLTVDTFWKIDTETGKKTRLVELSDMKEEYDAQNLLLNSDESMLFFINRYDGKIYKIAL